LSEDHNWEFDTVRGSSFASAQADEDSDAHEGPSTIRDYPSSNLPSSLRLLFGDSLPNQQDDYRPLPSQALAIPSDTQFISQTLVREVDDNSHSSLLSGPVVRARTHTGEVVSSNGPGVSPAEDSLDSSATTQSLKIVDGSLVDNEPKDDLDLASTATFQFPVDSKHMPRQSTSRITQRQASPTPRTAVNPLNTHQNALSLDTSSRHDIPLVPRTRSATTPPPMLNMERDFLISTHKTPNPIERTLRLNSSGKLHNLGTPGLKDVLKVWLLLQAAVRLLIG
jgi:protein-serine/threonine kinase